MKIHLFFFGILLIFLGCELIPEAMAPPPDESVRREYLQPDDTLYFSVRSLINEDPSNGLFSITDIGDTNVVFIDLSDSIITIVGRAFGSTIISAHYSGSIKDHLIYLNFIVLDGVPVFAHVGEEIIINPTNYSDFDGFLVDPDSIYFTLDEEIDLFTWRQGNNDNLILTGKKLGNQKVLFTTEKAGQVFSLYLLVEILVRPVVLGEVFTNDGCTPCVPVNLLLDELFEDEDYNENITMIRYHWNSPNPGDPMYHYNPEDMELRRQMYSVPFCPAAVVNGIHISYGQQNIESNVNGNILTELANESILYLGHETSLDNDSIVVDLEFLPFEVINGPLKSWAVVVEDSIYHEGYNGETIHMQVMRDLAEGEEWTILESDSSYSTSISLLKPEGYSEVNNRFHIVTIIQNTETNEVIQSNRLHVPLN
ncbi:MAG TPA: hypothetical protein QGH56_08560 [Candidatus Marinimicrobia bacterium]|nr:hypothetical protein [Candidatus Neomarinimicrobiota bacterium]